jgi:hypothetical protein
MVSQAVERGICCQTKMVHYKFFLNSEQSSQGFEKFRENSVVLGHRRSPASLVSPCHGPAPTCCSSLTLFLRSRCHRLFLEFERRQYFICMFNYNATLMSLNYSVYIYVSPADGDENGSALAKSGKKICPDPHELLSGCVTHHSAL